MIRKMQAVVFDVGNVLVHWAPQVIEDELAGSAPPIEPRSERSSRPYVMKSALGP